MWQPEDILLEYQEMEQVENGGVSDGAPCAGGDSWRTVNFAASDLLHVTEEDEILPVHSTISGTQNATVNNSDCDDSNHVGLRDNGEAEPKRLRRGYKLRRGRSK